MENIFQKEAVDAVIRRIEQLSPESQPAWGKMNVAQMLAHCNVTYEMAFENIHPKAKGLKKWLLKKFVKPGVVGPKPYKHNGRTAPQFLITDEREFEKEKQRLITYIQRTQEAGEAHFDGKESLSFGPLNAQEWNTMFYKHLDHHLRQFSV